ncbi:hypothetical protein NDU88_007996 [Pleurodeles waltl]|uniref:Uncharacterized protein n=1 Tax=Pleurodeles waltl TaxID=8319 RepID=A0AAV7NUN9_PLEWA|nr:hypothetical protein NDU88_007996 [Pleurodeles waltl]
MAPRWSGLWDFGPGPGPIASLGLLGLLTPAWITHIGALQEVVASGKFLPSLSQSEVSHSPLHEDQPSAFLSKLSPIIISSDRSLNAGEQVPSLVASPAVLHWLAGQDGLTVGCRDSPQDHSIPTLPSTPAAQWTWISTRSIHPMIPIESFSGTVLSPQTEFIEGELNDQSLLDLSCLQSDPLSSADKEINPVPSPTIMPTGLAWPQLLQTLQSTVLALNYHADKLDVQADLLSSLASYVAEAIFSSCAPGAHVELSSISDLARGPIQPKTLDDYFLPTKSVTTANLPLPVAIGVREHVIEASGAVTIPSFPKLESTVPPSSHFLYTPAQPVLVHSTPSGADPMGHPLLSKREKKRLRKQWNNRQSQPRQGFSTNVQLLVHPEAQQLSQLQGAPRVTSPSNSSPTLPVGSFPQIEPVKGSLVSTTVHGTDLPFKDCLILAEKGNRDSVSVSVAPHWDSGVPAYPAATQFVSKAVHEITDGDALDPGSSNFLKLPLDNRSSPPVILPPSLRPVSAEIPALGGPADFRNVEEQLQPSLPLCPSTIPSVRSTLKLVCTSEYRSKEPS